MTCDPTDLIPDEGPEPVPMTLKEAAEVFLAEVRDAHERCRKVTLPYSAAVVLAEHLRDVVRAGHRPDDGGGGLAPPPGMFDSGGES